MSVLRQPLLRALLAAAVVTGCIYPASQSESEPCDPALGVDACGAGLVCAALDGRTQPTCYRERSRLDLTECSDDLLCVSGSCDDDSGLCRSSRLTPCEQDTGCAPDALGLEIECRDDDGQLRCLRPAQPSGGQCLDDAECQSVDCSCNLGGASRECC